MRRQIHQRRNHTVAARNRRPAADHTVRVDQGHTQAAENHIQPAGRARSKVRALPAALPGRRQSLRAVLQSWRRVQPIRVVSTGA